VRSKIDEGHTRDSLPAISASVEKRIVTKNVRSVEAITLSINPFMTILL
jgi:hypothetical protein